MKTIEHMGSIESASKRKFPFHLKRFFPILSGILLTAISLAYFSLPLLGNWLVREDPIHPADAIAVLSGSFPERAVEAAGLYRDGYAREVWLTHPVKQNYFDAFGNFQKFSEDARNFRVLCAFGVPQEAIHVLDTPIVNTADELNAIDFGLKERGDSSVIVVTSKAHTRRVFSLWDKYHLGDGEILIHAVSDDTFSPSRWWRTRSSRAEGIHELLGIVNVWAGMPVHRPLPQPPA
ncbi:MAG TPA: YdcF family protein [Candidatus Dormibacteraeota bacterium]|jgi:uncharacterized SAM-binding protein YcdF (DUF218 family)|nr:YdcF family protein [Candidatus Dormibacteraeota bacterium]